MNNFYTDNKDLQFVLENIDLKEIVSLREGNFGEANSFDHAPKTYEEAKENYRRALEVIGEVTGDRIAPRSRTVDEEGPQFENNKVTYHPLTQANLKDLKNAGVMGVMLPYKYGGLNFPNTIYTMMTELVSRADGSLQNLFGLQDISETISEFGTEEQKQNYLPGFASGESDGSMDLTEPDSGSDLQSVRLKATQDPKTGQWYLNGMKRFITNGCAKVHLVLARSEEASSDGRGLSMFICTACPQLIVRRIEHKLGIHGVATCELQYNHVPAELCGLRRRGLTKYIMALMNGARVAIAGQALGIAEAAYRDAKKYASERTQFKQQIDKFPAVYDMLTRMKIKLVAARTLLYETTKTVDLRSVYSKLVEHNDAANVNQAHQERFKYISKMAAILTPMAKALCTETSNEVAYDGIQIHGGTGYMKDFNAERYARDARITNIYEGTTQLQVVAAIGGVMQRTLDKSIDELLRLPYDGALERMTHEVRDMLTKHKKAIAFVQAKKDSAYHDLMARNLVEMEIIIYTSLLMMRDALKDRSREIIAEKYVLDSIPQFNAKYEKTVSGDYSTIDRHREIIDY